MTKSKDVTTDVDLSQLVVNREPPPLEGLERRHWTTRYVIPGLLLCGFVTLVLWAMWDVLFPPHSVTVVPVVSSTASLRREGTPLFKAAGWVEPRPTPIHVPALSPGVVKQLLVVEDDEVSEGQPIAHLIDEDAQLARDKAIAMQKLREAELQRAEAILEAANTRLAQPLQLEAALREAEANLAKITSQWENLPKEIEQATARLELAKEDYRGKNSGEIFVSELARERARSEMKSAQAALEGLRQRTQSLEREKEALRKRTAVLKLRWELRTDEKLAQQQAEADVLAASAKLEEAKLAVAEAQLRWKRMTVLAPCAGRVYRLMALPGTRLTSASGGTKGADGSTVVTLYQPEVMQVRVDVRFDDLLRVRPEQPVRLENPSLEEPLQGKVLFASSEADIQKNTLEVKVAITSPLSGLKPDMLMDVTFLAPAEPKTSDTSSQEMHLYVPKELLHKEGDSTFVWVADLANGRARRIAVQTGATNAEGLVEVTEGLTLASRLIAAGSEGLQPDQRIRIK